MVHFVSAMFETFLFVFPYPCTEEYSACGMALFKWQEKPSEENLLLSRKEVESESADKAVTKALESCASKWTVRGKYNC